MRIFCFCVLVVCLVYADGYFGELAPKAVSSPSAGTDQVYSGRATYYTEWKTGLGSCGIPLSRVPSELCALSSSVMSSNSVNPNKHTLCDPSSCIKVWPAAGSESQGIIVKITDTCPSCGAGDIDLSDVAFTKLAPLSQGVLQVKWKFVDCSSGQQTSSGTSQPSSSGNPVSNTPAQQTPPSSGNPIDNTPAQQTNTTGSLKTDQQPVSANYHPATVAPPNNINTRISTLPSQAYNSTKTPAPNHPGQTKDMLDSGSIHGEPYNLEDPSKMPYVCFPKSSIPYVCT